MQTRRQRAAIPCGARTATLLGLLGFAILFPAGAALAQGTASDPGKKRDLVAFVGGLTRLGSAAPDVGLQRDITAISETLQGFQFKLVGIDKTGACGDNEVQVDLAKEQLSKALACFETAAAASIQAVFYWAGPTVAAADGAALVPLDGFADTGLVAGQIFPLTAVDRALETAKVRLALVIIDGSRPKPLSATDAAPTYLARLPPVAFPRIVAYGGPAGAVPATDAIASATVAANTYTQTLGDVLAADLDRRALGLQGEDVRTLLYAAATAARPAWGSTGDVVVDNVGAAPVLFGTVPTVATEGICDTLKRRSRTIKRCEEIAAAVDICGPAADADIKTLLNERCPTHARTLLQTAFRNAMVRPIKANACDGLRTLASTFEKEPGIDKVPEFGEVQNLSRYTCALEDSKRMLTEFPQIIEMRDCEKARTFQKQFDVHMEPAQRIQIATLLKQVCCPEVSVISECLQRKVAVQRIQIKLERRGCTLGFNANARNARTDKLMQQLNRDGKYPVDLAANGITLDRVWTSIDALPVEKCKCAPNEIVGAEGNCQKR